MHTCTQPVKSLYVEVAPQPKNEEKTKNQGDPKNDDVPKNDGNPKMMMNTTDHALQIMYYRLNITNNK